MAKPRYHVIELDDGRHAIDVEHGWRIVFWRDGDQCHVKIVVASEQAARSGTSAMRNLMRDQTAPEAA